jgi:hypothetical protein
VIDSECRRLQCRPRRSPRRRSAPGHGRRPRRSRSVCLTPTRSAGSTIISCSARLRRGRPAARLDDLADRLDRRPGCPAVRCPPGAPHPCHAGGARPGARLASPGRQGAEGHGPAARLAAGGAGEPVVRAVGDRARPGRGQPRPPGNALVPRRGRAPPARERAGCRRRPTSSRSASAGRSFGTTPLLYPLLAVACAGQLSRPARPPRRPDRARPTLSLWSLTDRPGGHTPSRLRASTGPGRPRRAVTIRPARFRSLARLRHVPASPYLSAWSNVAAAAQPDVASSPSARPEPSRAPPSRRA